MDLAERKKRKEEVEVYLKTKNLTMDVKGHTVSLTLDKAISQIASSYASFANVLFKQAKKFEGKSFLEIIDHLIDDKLEADLSRTCYRCAMRLSICYIQNNEIIIQTYNEKKFIDLTPCEYKHGFPEYSVEIDIPSGKMLLGNFINIFNIWIGNLKKEEHGDKYSICNLIGRKLCTEEKAKYGYVEMNVGNCACDMFEINKEKFIVGANFYEYEEYDDPWADYKKVGEVCTDFWGYGLMDYKNAKKHGVTIEKLEGIRYLYKYKDINNEDKSMCGNVINCKPGRYRFTHRYHLIKERNQQQIYTNIVRIGK